MNACLTILKRTLLELVRSRGNVIWMLMLPVVFTFVFGVLPYSQGDSKLTVSVVDHDNSPVSRGLIQEMKESGSDAVQVLSEGEASEGLRNFKTDVVITFPAGLADEAVSHRPLDIQAVVSPNIGQNNSVSSVSDLQNQLRQWALAGQVALVQAEGSRQLDLQQKESAFVAGMQQARHIHPAVATAEETLSGGGLQSDPLGERDRSVLGFAVMFIIFILFGSTGNILQEKVRGTWSRLKTTPASRASVLTGYGLSLFVIGWVQYLIMVLTGRFLFHVRIPFNAWMALTVSLYIFAIAGLALCVSGLVRTQEQHMTTGGFIASISSMIAGTYWPLDLEPTWMQHLAWFMPQSWALSAFQTAAQSGVTLSVMLWPLTVLAGFAIVFFSVGMVQLRYA
ncbi:ABC transporter permease [Alicyclobacillus fastidiosus]|uniref:ABC transporter permease n=1 Tax=Alicyclobacillus fastidiosus TaxID=392011 RepID=A0ABV5AJR5_9BACL|nr:ABC transporter permease [Alicyclobacillus fastidiosus]WEH07999.1 ABC transporter permease [Alicyclobacillus fastidiosus]